MQFLNSFKDEMEDMMLEANEIQEVMSRSYGINDDIDEAELEAEFDALGTFKVEYLELTLSSKTQTFTACG